MKRRVIILFILIYMAAGAVSCVQFKKMELAYSISGTSDDLMLSSSGYADLLTSVTGPEESPEAEAPAPAAARMFTASHKRGRLFIRKGPSTSYPIIGFLSPGDTGNVISEKNGWALVEAGELTGYVSMNYLTLQEQWP